MNQCNFLSWIDKLVRARGLEVTLVIMEKVKLIEVEAETEKVLTKTKKEMHAKKSTFTEESHVIWGT